MADPQNKETSSESELQIIGGIPFSKLFNEDIIEEVLRFEPKDGDVIIASYPKTGTTWMQYIVLQILTKAECFPAFEELLQKVVPFMEMSGVSAVEELTKKPRVYKHHIPYNAMKKNPNTKIIYTYRKPEDTLVSYYHFTQDLYGPLKFEEHFENFMSGNISYGRYFEHVLSYLKHKPHGNILLVSYEKLKNQTREEILRVARFLGEEYHDSLVNDESLLNRIIENTSFDHMKKNLTLRTPQQPQKDKHPKHPHAEYDEDVPKKEVNFFRKGLVGEGKSTLTKEQFQKVRKLAEDLMKKTEIFNEWYGD